MPVTRKKRAPLVPKLIASESVYIDPLNCDSTINWKIVARRNLWGDVQLSDCNKKIEWFFSNDAEAVEKIDNAIASLTKFRDKFVEARSVRKPRPKSHPRRSKA